MLREVTLGTVLVPTRALVIVSTGRCCSSSCSEAVSGRVWLPRKE